MSEYPTPECFEPNEIDRFISHAKACNPCRSMILAGIQTGRGAVDIDPPPSRRQVTGKEALLKPHLLETIERLKKLIALDAPGVIIGADAFAVFATTLVVYGESAGGHLISALRDANLQVNERGFAVIDPANQIEISLCDTREEAEAEIAEINERFANAAKV